MKKDIVFQAVFMLSIIIIGFAFVAYIVLAKYYKEDKKTNVVLKIDDVINIENELLKDNNLSIKYLLNKTNESTYLFNYELLFNDKRISNTHIDLTYALSELDKNKLLDMFKNNSEIHLIKGLDNVDYYLLIVKDFYEENLFILNQEGILLTRLTNKSDTKINSIEGENNDLFYLNNSYNSYLIERDKIRYLKKEECETENNILVGYILNINDNVVSVEKSNDYIYDGDVKCININENIY